MCLKLQKCGELKNNISAILTESAQRFKFTRHFGSSENCINNGKGL